MLGVKNACAPPVSGPKPAKASGKASATGGVPAVPAVYGAVVAIPVPGKAPRPAPAAVPGAGQLSAPVPDAPAPGKGEAAVPGHFTPLCEYGLVALWAPPGPLFTEEPG